MITLSHNQEVLLTRQRHEADRAGLHYDIRLVVGGIAHSWATRKEMPEVGKSVILWEQPDHDRSYALSKKVIIPKGQYGSGSTILDFVRKGVISNPENAEDKFVLNTNDSRFLFRHSPKFGNGAWLFKNLGEAKKEPYREEESSHVVSNGNKYYINNLLQASDKTPVKQFKVEDLKWILGNKLNASRVDNADTSTPLLVQKDKDGHLVVLDGEHRLTKAVREGLVTLPGKMIQNKYLEKISAIKYETIPLSLLQQANSDSDLGDWVDLSDTDRKRVGIHHDSKLVGFFQPRKSGAHWRTGSIHVQPEHRNKGLATEATNKFFEDKSSGISFIEPSNKASMRAYEKAGFTKQKEWTHEDGTLYNIMKKMTNQISPNKYLEKSAFITAAAAAHFIGSGAATHVVQNIATKKMLHSPHVSKYLADSFSEGMHGVVNKSLKSRMLRTMSGAFVPDINIAHKTAHELGVKLGPHIQSATKRQQVGLRMATEGRFDALKKHNLHNDPLIKHVYNTISEKHNMPSLDHLVANSSNVQKLFKDKSHPLLSNVVSNMGRGHVPSGPNFKPGNMNVSHPLAGAALLGIKDPAAGVLSGTKILASSKTLNKNKYVAKVTHWMENKFVKSPILKGVKNSKDGVLNSKYGHKATELLASPVTAQLKRTSAALADATK